MPASHVYTITPTIARRLNITKQRLDANQPAANGQGIGDVLRDIRCLQLDPISHVSRSHFLVLFSRLGAYHMADVDRAIYEEGAGFEYWAHCASIVPTEDYPLHNVMMRHYLSGDGAWTQRTREWMQTNQALHDFIIAELEVNGAMLSRQLEADGLHPEGWVSTGWTSGRNVSRMLDFLWMTGRIMVAERKGGQKVWDFTERVLPSLILNEPLTHEQMTYTAAQHAIKALGIAKMAHIKQHYLRGRYTQLDAALRQLETDGRILRVRVEGDKRWTGDWFVHIDDVPTLERLIAGEWNPRTTLLSPFDNLICDRNRTRAMFDFDFTIEIYVPKEKRQYGYYVLPILHGDQIIGRIDPQFHRKSKLLEVSNIYVEPDAPQDVTTGNAVAGAIQQLGQFLGATSIQVGSNVPNGWTKSLKRL